MKRKNLFLMLLSTALGLGVVVPSAFKKNSYLEEEVGDDPIQYATSSVVDLDNPHLKGGIVRAGDAQEEDDEESATVSTVKIHYVNDDFKCQSRAFYIWSAGIDGVEYSDEHNGADIMEYAEDGSSMTITLNINAKSPDSRFKDFVGLPSIFYIVKYKMISEGNLNWGGQSDDVELVYAEFPIVAETCEVWVTPAAGGGMAQFATEEETKVDGVKLAKFSDFKTIHCTATDDSMNVKWDLYAFDQNYYKVKLKKRDAIKNNYKVLSGKNALTKTNKEFDIEFPYTAKINMVYCLVSKEASSTSDLAKTVFVSFEQLYDTPKFEHYYCYEGDDLGMTYNKNFTTFKVWAPIAANMTLLLYEKGNDTPSIYADGNVHRTDKYKKGWFMAYKQGGIWEITVKGDLKDYYYNFQVDNYQGSTTTVDPYVTAVGCSGVRGLVYEKKDTNPVGWDNVPETWDGVEEYDITTPQQLSIYEVHVRDFTGDSSWKSNQGNKNGTYKAFVESGTRLANHNTVTTGYDHLMDLGINTVQLMPVFDADNDESMERGGLEKYNWGYNPQNYNAVEGAYSSDPHDALARIKEYKELIVGLANPGTGKKHVRVTMDVVYNHVSSVSAHPFTKLMPKYYFRYDANGELYNGSGCHNEVRSEAKMCRKFIIDSVYMWAKEYKIKGFRFDLMGLIDYQTMNLLKQKLSLLDRDIYLYGEGWSAEGYHGSNYMNWGTETWQVYNRCNNFREIDGYDDDSLCYLGAFNNTGRNGVKGDNGGGQPCYPETGFMQKSFDGNMGDFNARVVDMCWGIHRGVSNYAKQTVNYISCHDNWTVVDQLWQTMNQEVGDEDSRKNTPGNIGEIAHASLAAHALVFASNGVAFMLGGEEIFRTKEVSQTMIDQKKVLVDTYSPMYGRYVSHNSYNSPIEVNSFKWGNKVSVTLGGATITDSELQYNDAWKTLTHLHEKETFVSPSRYDEMWPGNKTSDDQPIENLWWRIDSSGMGIQVDETFIFVNGRFSSGSSFSLPAGSTVKFKYGAYEVDSWNPHFGGFGVIVCQRG